MNVFLTHPLTDIGEQQAQLVGQFLADGVDMPGSLIAPFELTHLYCSAMTRAMQTAQPIAQVLDMQPEVWVDVHEIGGLFLADENGNRHGLSGPTRSEITAQFPGYVLPDTITENGWWDASRGGETPAEFIARAIRVSFALKKRLPSDERIGIVSHGAFLDMLIKAFLSQIPTHPNALFYTHYNTGITRMDFDEGYHGATVKDRLRLHYLNRVDHVPPELRTW